MSQDLRRAEFPVPVSATCHKNWLYSIISASRKRFTISVASTICKRILSIRNWNFCRNCWIFLRVIATWKRWVADSKDASRSPSPFFTNRSCSFWTNRRWASILCSDTGNLFHFSAVRDTKLLIDFQSKHLESSRPPKCRPWANSYRHHSLHRRSQTGEYGRTILSFD